MINDESRKAISQLMSKKAGLHFPASRWGDLERGLRNASQDLELKNINQFVEQLLEHAETKQIECLINHLTIGETYFFREKPVLDVFTKNILPGLIRKHENTDKTLHFWSAGCCSGEEPYTIAIILQECIPNISDWNIKIFATDINRDFLEKARIGNYSAWSFRETPLDLKRKYFAIRGNMFSINPAIKKMVNFIHMNLIDGNPGIHGIHPDQCDVIFCRNVLMYFTAEGLDKAYELFYKTLAPGSWLLTSPVEVPVEVPSKFSLIRLGEMTVLQKSSILKKDEFKFILQDKKEHNKTILLKPQKLSNKAFTAEVKKTTSKPGTEKPYQDPLKPARQAFQNKSYEQVICLLEAMTVTEHSSEAFLLLIKANANLGRLETAKKLCDELLAKNANTPYYFYLAASVLIELHEDARAEEALRKALYLDHEMVLAHFLLGNLFRRKGQMTLAKKHYRNILESLGELPDNVLIPESEGMTAGYFRRTVNSFPK